MSVHEFWLSVRTAARLIAPTVTADSPQIDSSAIERILRGSAIWLTPRAVAGFDADDFQFLPGSERQQLSNSVAKFLDVACKADPKKPATELQIQDALPHFLRIVEILGGNRYADADAFVIGKKIEQRLVGQLPNTVLELRFETGEDSSGGDALWIWVILKDEVAESTPVLLSNTGIVRERLTDAVRESGIKRWPYVRFRTQADLEPLRTSASEK